jgi:4-diphosphocytidyl-2-C-methyl-D-erythritol kinase
MKSLHDVPAPAKLNLFLHITGRRPDGYHELQSVFMLIDWCDTLHFEKRSGGNISREDLTLALPAQDLITRAAHLLQSHTGCTEGVHIAVEKQIPAQAGMGGGSSDAASCLLALNRLWGLGLSRDALERIGLTLGADVPFFLRGRNAWVEGIGERITPVDLPPARFLVAKPVQGLETARIFGHPELSRATEPAILSRFAAHPYGFGHNDLQPVAEKLSPDVRQALHWVADQGGEAKESKLQARMTGSGSAVFAKLPQDEAPRLAEIPPGWQVEICSNLAAHPLVEWAASDE